MASETGTATDVSTENVPWVVGIEAGLVAGVVFGLLIQFVIGAMPAVGALYGAPGLLTGWIAHLFHSAVFGAVFAWLAGTDALAGYADGVARSAGLGLGYGFVLWLVFLVFVWPVWLGAVGFPLAPPVPNLAVPPLVGHLVYGLVLGAVYPVLRNAQSSPGT